MEDKSRRLWWILITAIAPIAWGSSYVVTRQLLPADAPLWGGLLRALPAGLILLAISRRLPTGSWWWRSLLLGALNVGGFFVLVYIAGQRLPSSLAATLMSTSALVMMLFAWGMLRQRPRLIAVLGALVGLAGVAVMLGLGGGPVDLWGVAVALGAMVASSFGYILTSRWGSDIPAVTMSSWQLLGGSVLLIPVAIVVEGPPPALTPVSALGFVYLSVVATAIAYVAWFTGLRLASRGRGRRRGAAEPGGRGRARCGAGRRSVRSCAGHRPGPRAGRRRTGFTAPAAQADAAGSGVAADHGPVRPRRPATLTL